MHFAGGKGLWAAVIVDEIERWRCPDIPLVEVGCGACNLTERWDKPVIAYDINPALISLWTACQNGWRPPSRDEITEELHAKYKTNPVDPSDPMTAFLMFGCSFRGVWRGGFARTYTRQEDGRPRTKNSIASSRVSTIRKAESISTGVRFVLGSYSDVHPVERQIVYVDPPYQGTAAEGIGGIRKALTPRFDHADFWKHAREWVRRKARVFVSEEHAPDDWIAYRSWNVKRSLGNSYDVDRNGPTKLEHLWVHRDSDMVTKVRRRRT